MKTPQSDQIIQTLQKVFKKRDTHPLPQKLDEPPVQWISQFISMATECSLSQTLQTSFKQVSEFYNRIVSN